MSGLKILGKYVIASDVAVLGGVPAEYLLIQDQIVATACTAFLSRASFHGAELHVPNLFFSEVMSIIYTDFVHTQVLSVNNGNRLLGAIFGTTWEYHFPVWESVYEIQHVLGYFKNTHIAEFLSVAADHGLTFITTNAKIIDDARAAKLKVKIMLITDHPWAKSGGVDEFPISS